ncbi:MAG: AAA family ATPase [Gemmataceae bacterium]
MTKNSTTDFYDSATVAAANATADAAIQDLLSSSNQSRGVVVTAPAGAGKSHLIAKAVDKVRAEGRRVAVAAPTNEQAFGLVRTIAKMHCSGHADRMVSFVPASSVALPELICKLDGVQQVKAKDANAEELIVGTLSKFGDAFGRGDLHPFDVLLIDEAYQADSAKYFAVGGLAPVHMLVGDAGQISPFAAMVDPARWRGLPEDPLQTAVGVLLRNHPSTPVYGLPITRRLDQRGAPVAKLFYPQLAFNAAVLSGVRSLELTQKGGKCGDLDPILDNAADHGWAYAELPRRAVLQADPEAMGLIVDLVERLFERTPHVQCERTTETSPLRPERVAVGVCHNDQKDQLRIRLQQRGLSGVVVETANKLQGLEFEVVFVWHPLAGLLEADEFHLDPGRLCVLLTRHRQACVVVGREGDPDLLTDRPPPPTAGYLGHDFDPLLDGWEVHQAVYAALEEHRIGWNSTETSLF